MQLPITAQNAAFAADLLRREIDLESMRLHGARRAYDNARIGAHCERLAELRAELARAESMLEA